MKTRLLIISVFWLSSFYKSSGQNALTLDQAVQIGLENNFQIQLSRIDKDIAMTNNTWGEAGRYPTITLNGSNPNSILDRNNPTSFVNGILRSTSLNGTLNAGWTIFGGFEVNLTKERLDLLQQQSEGLEALVVENTVQAIILAYRKVILENEKLQVYKELMSISRDRLTYAQFKNESGLSSSFDVRQFNNAYLEDSASFVTQALNLRNAKRNLNLLLARDINLEIECSDSLSVTLKQINTDSIRKKLTSNNEQLKLEFLNLELLKNSNQLSKSSLYPTLSVNVGSTSSTSSFNLEGQGSGRGSSQEYYANFTLSYTLFNGGKIKRGIKTTSYQIESGQIKTEELKLSLDNELISEVDLYNTRSTILMMKQRQEEFTNKNLDLAKEKVKSGLISSFEFRDFQISHTRNRLNTIEAVFELSSSETEIQRLTGQLFSTKN